MLSSVATSGLRITASINTDAASVGGPFISPQSCTRGQAITSISPVQNQHPVVTNYSSERPWLDFLLFPVVETPFIDGVEEYQAVDRKIPSGAMNLTWRSSLRYMKTVTFVSGRRSMAAFEGSDAGVAASLIRDDSWIPGWLEVGESPAS